MQILKILTEEFKIEMWQVENTVKLIDDNNTIPFIARYRKELTGSLDDQLLRSLYDRLVYLRNLAERKEQIRKSIAEQGKMTAEIESAIESAMIMTEVEDIYRPFKPKRKTRASIAKEKGLAPLADIIFEQKAESDLTTLAENFINEEKGILTAADAINGAKDIIAEMISDDADIRKILRREIFNKGSIESKAADPKQKSVYEMYYDYSEKIKTMPGHRILALNRGENEKFLNVKIIPDTEDLLNRIAYKVVKKDGTFLSVMTEIIEDSFKRLIFPSVEREIRTAMTEKAEEGAIKVFSKNLQQLLLQPPIKDKTVLALDPAFRTGCKTAVIDGTGKVLHTAVIYPTPPQNKIAEAKKTIAAIITDYCVDIIAIGNGTASRETEKFVVDMLKEMNKKMDYIIVNEAGASVYSASKLGAEEFPDFDVALRSAVSIGRRLQDPLAELCKIDPKAIGVGQYQHDMNQKRLSETLGGVVESCVNSVGVDLNTASPSLLSYVSGVTTATAKNIIKYREENGKFVNRKELKKVSKLGPKAFEQCAGFLRITDGDNPLDNTAVHPESYDASLQLLKKLGYTPHEIIGNKAKSFRSRISNLEQTAEEIGIGVLTLKDILEELEKPGRDPRDEMPAPIFKSDVMDIGDLKEGMILNGTVRNIIDFGAFVDIGVHQDGLVHISQISGKYIKHPLDAVSIGDVVKVKVLSVDPGKKRISLTMRL